MPRSYPRFSLSLPLSEPLAYRDDDAWVGVVEAVFGQTLEGSVLLHKQNELCWLVEVRSDI